MACLYNLSRIERETRHQARRRRMNVRISGRTPRRCWRLSVRRQGRRWLSRCWLPAGFAGRRRASGPPSATPPGINATTVSSWACFQSTRTNFAWTWLHGGSIKIRTAVKHEPSAPPDKMKMGWVQCVLCPPRPLTLVCSVAYASGSLPPFFRAEGRRIGSRSMGGRVFTSLRPAVPVRYSAVFPRVIHISRCSAPTLP